METIKILLAPLLMIIGGIITWIIKARTEELKVIKEQLREEQRQIYKDILAPIIQLLGSIHNEKNQATAVKKIQSIDYKKTAFDLSMVGSDGVVKAWSDFMQYMYTASEEDKATKPLKPLELLGTVMLEIRKNLGHKNTKLKAIELLKFLVTDIDKLI